MKTFIYHAFGFLIILASINIVLEAEESLIAKNRSVNMNIVSPAFKNMQPIPRKYTCEGSDISPPLSFSQIPSEAKSLALIVDDPDAPKGTFDHWIAWNIPTTTHSLSEGARVPNEGRNGFGVSHYRGPCPPPGSPHRYFFKIYALDIMLDLPQGSTKDSLEQAMQNHIIGRGELIGTYQRQ